MTTINMKDYVEENANKGNEAAKEVMETISTIEPIVGNKNRTPEEKASDIGELKGILKAAIASGKSKVIVSVPVKLLAIDTSYQIPERTERSLKKLIKNWDDVQCMPLIGVPHFEVGYVAVVDGTGRVRASQVIDSKKYEELDVLMVLNVPSEPKDRQLFEAKQYENQNIGNEPLREYQKHGARLIRSDKATLLFSKMQKKYGFNYSVKTGQRPEEMLGSYNDVLDICRIQGEECMDYIFGICTKSGFCKLSNGYSLGIIRALRDMWKYYANDRERTKAFFEEKLRNTTPALLKAEARSTYKYLSEKSAISFYLEDMAVKELGVEQSREITNNGTRLIPVRKFA